MKHAGEKEKKKRKNKAKAETMMDFFSFSHLNCCMTLNYTRQHSLFQYVFTYMYVCRRNETEKSDRCVHMLKTYGGKKVPQQPSNLQFKSLINLKNIFLDGCRELIERKPVKRVWLRQSTAHVCYTLVYSFVIYFDFDFHLVCI